jgi:hypothetical protein
VGRIRLLFSLSLVTAALLAACTQESKPAGPTFSGRLFFLSGDNPKSADLAELTAGPAGKANNYQVVTSGVLEAVASPDQTRLLYTTKEGVMLRDFGTGEVKSLIKGDNSCLAWAPDGNHFSYKQKTGETTKLYASDLEGKMKLVLDYPNDSEDCAQWISADRLVFDRFVGAAQKKANEQLKPNTTTVATVGDAVKTKDTPRKWTVESVCAKSNNGFLRSADQGKLLIAKNIDHFESLDPSPASCSECRFIGYAAQSCVPFFVEQPTSTTTELFYLNPTNWQKQRPSTINRTFSPSAKAMIKSSAKLMIIGDAGNLFLVDTESGAIVALMDKPAESSNGASPVPVPIVWIEH